MSRKDHYYNKSKQEGYRARSAYKLKQLNDEYSVVNQGNSVVDLGAAPGGWMQVAAQAVGQNGSVVGVDLQRIKDFDGDDIVADVSTVRGDMTDEDTRERVKEAVGGHVDVVISDMAPNMTGEYNLDHARSVHLARQALETAKELLGEGGNFAVKVFEGPDMKQFREDVAKDFAFSTTTSPKASRESSSELYVVAKNFLTGPVREGDIVDVEIEDVGDEGDGIAKIDGFTIFVPDTEAGDEVEVRVTDVKPRFAFGKKRD